MPGCGCHPRVSPPDRETRRAWPWTAWPAIRFRRALEGKTSALLRGSPGPGQGAVVAVELLVQRERERMRFRSGSYWDLPCETDPTIRTTNTLPGRPRAAQREATGNGEKTSMNLPGSCRSRIP